MFECADVRVCLCANTFVFVCLNVPVAYMLKYVTMHVLMCEYVNLSMFYCVCAPIN